MARVLHIVCEEHSHIVVAVVVRSAMGWRGHENCGHLASGGFTIWDISGWAEEHERSADIPSEISVVGIVLERFDKNGLVVQPYLVLKSVSLFELNWCDLKASVGLMSTDFVLDWLCMVEYKWSRWLFVSWAIGGLLGKTYWPAFKVISSHTWLSRMVGIPGNSRSKHSRLSDFPTVQLETYLIEATWIISPSKRNICE